MPISEKMISKISAGDTDYTASSLNWTTEYLRLKTSRWISRSARIFLDQISKATDNIVEKVIPTRSLMAKKIEL
jgi:hypothetical protein